MNLDDQIEALVEATGIEPDLVRTITIDYRNITVESYWRNEQGSKFMWDDGSPATQTKTYEHHAFRRVTA